MLSKQVTNEMKGERFGDWIVSGVLCRGFPSAMLRIVQEMADAEEELISRPNRWPWIELGFSKCGDYRLPFFRFTRSAGVRSVWQRGNEPPQPRPNSSLNSFQLIHKSYHEQCESILSRCIAYESLMNWSQLATVFVSTVCCNTRLCQWTQRVGCWAYIVIGSNGRHSWKHPRKMWKLVLQMQTIWSFSNNCKTLNPKRFQRQTRF